MANAVYLFRLYCEPLRDNSTRALAPVSPWPVDEQNPFDTVTIDQVVSLPANTPDLVTQANTIVQAYSTLCVGNSIHLVAVFQLSDSKPADHNTPVMVLHPFYMDVEQPPFWVDGSADYTRWDTLHHLPRIVEYGGNDSWATRGFRSYDLMSNNGENNSLHAEIHEFYQLNLARASNIGRISNHFVARAVDYQDFIYSWKSTLKLRTDTPLWRLRWPIYRQLMNRLPYQHTGYHLQADGSVRLGRISQGDYIPMGVTFRAMDRKRFKRRARATSKVSSQWWRTVTRMMRVLQQLEVYGYSEGRLTYTVFPAGTPLFSTAVQHEFLKRNLYTLTEFLNVVGVATGNNSLLLSMPDTTPESRSADFDSIVQFLTNGDGSLSQYSVKGNTDNVHVLQVIHQLTANLIRQINDFQNDVAAFIAMPDPINEYERPGHGMILVGIYDAFASLWPEMQADLIKILGLLLTWHLTFEPVEKTRAAAGEAQILGLVRRDMPKWLSDVIPERFPPITTWPNVTTSRFAYDLPDFAPFRVWDVETVDSNGQQAVIDEIARQDREAMEAFRLYNIEQDQAARAARQARRELEMQRIVADYDSDIPPWISLQGNILSTQPYERYWYNRFAVPMSDEVRARALTVTDTRLRFQLENKRRRSPGEVYRYQYPGAPAEFVTNAPPPDITLPFPTYTRWVRRKVGSATVDTQQVWTETGVDNYLNEMRYHVPNYQDVEHFEFSDAWPLDVTL